MSSILLLPLNKTKKNRLLLLTKNINDSSNNPPFPPMPNPLVVYATKLSPQTNPPLLDRAGSPGPSCLLHDRPQWSGGHDNSPESKLSLPTSLGGHEAGDGQLPEPPMDQQYHEPLGSGSCTNVASQHATTLGSSNPLQSPHQSNDKSKTSFSSLQWNLPKTTLCFFPRYHNLLQK
ncbi:hypothetical protein KY289_007998 [Solanum tuberosum]|nr:hypothetical protein KY289_007998 [Solanum tuberosum]